MIRIVQPTKKPDLTPTPSDWRTSSQGGLGAKCNGMPLEGCTSDADIAAIDSMLDNMPAATERSGDKITVAKSVGLRAPIAITPESAAELMVQNYIRQNGGVIVDNKKTNQVILG